MTLKGKLAHKLHQLQKRVSRDFKNEGHNPDLKTSMRISRIKELKKEINKSHFFLDYNARSL